MNLYYRSIMFLILTNNLKFAKSAPANTAFESEKDIPAEPFNPSEFEEAERMAYDENEQGSTPYLNEKKFQNRLTITNKNGLIDSDRLWRKFGEYVFIPYIISSHFSRNDRHTIVKAFENFHEHTCIRFIPWTTQKDYIHIIYGEGCDSEAGRVGGEQTISLGENCNYTYVAIHEINHAVGFWHEHNRPDRDFYINVYLDNVKEENQFNFEKLSSKKVHSFGQEYDTSSIMHYDEYAFSIQPGELVVLEPFVPDETMGLAKELSESDISKINKMYKCLNLGAYKPQIDNPFMSDLQSNICEDSSQCVRLDKSKCKGNIWMQSNCKTLCGACGNCKDLHSNCAIWTLRGSCQTQSDYMYIYCPRSCLMCP